MQNLSAKCLKIQYNTIQYNKDSAATGEHYRYLHSQQQQTVGQTVAAEKTIFLLKYL